MQLWFGFFSILRLFIPSALLPSYNFQIYVVIIISSQFIEFFIEVFWAKLGAVKISDPFPIAFSQAGVSLSLLYLSLVAPSVKSFGWEFTKARKSAWLWKSYCLL